MLSLGVLAMAYPGTLLNVPFSEKDDVKELGALWAPDLRKWYVPPGVDMRPFASWLPQERGETAASHSCGSPPTVRLHTAAGIYVGQGAGYELFQRLQEARESVTVVSPYLTARSVDMLLTARDRGATVSLLTMDIDVLKKPEVAARLVRQECRRDEDACRRRARGMKVSLALAALLVPVALLAAVKIGPAALLLLTALPALLCAWVVFYSRAVNTYSYHAMFPRLRVLVSPFTRSGLPRTAPFLHSKIYIVDGVVYLGSLNWTEQGLFDNYELCARLDDSDAVRSVEAHVDAMFAETKWPEVAATGIGKQLVAADVWKEARH